MPRKRKGELPSGNIRRQVYIGMQQKIDKSGNPIFNDDGSKKMVRKYRSITAANSYDADEIKLNMIQTLPEVRPLLEMTLKEAIEKYINSSDKVLSPTTLNGYKVIMNFGFQSIIDTKITLITNEMLRIAVNEEAKRMTQGKKPHPISPKTVANEFGLIASVLKFYRPSLNLAVKLPAKEKKQNELSTPDVIFKIVKGSPIELPVLLAMWLSFSLSEIMGLSKSESLSSDGNFIMINQVVVTVNGNQHKKSAAKQYTRHRMHRIPLYIKELIAKLETDKFVTITAGAVSHRFMRLIQKSDVPYMTFHDLRHVSASVMKYLNVPDKYAQERGGWKTDAVMKDTYMQTFTSARIEVDDTIDTYYENLLFNSSINENQKRYAAWLLLLGLDDNEDEKKNFERFESLTFKLEKNLLKSMIFQALETN